MRVTATARRSRFWDGWWEDWEQWRVSPKLVRPKKVEVPPHVPVLYVVPREGNDSTEYRLEHRGAVWELEYHEGWLSLRWVPTCCIAPWYAKPLPTRCRTCEQEAPEEMANLVWIPYENLGAGLSKIRGSVEDQLLWADESLDVLSVSVEGATVVDLIHHLTGSNADWASRWAVQPRPRVARQRGRDAILHSMAKNG